MVSNNYRVSISTGSVSFIFGRVHFHFSKKKGFDELECLSKSDLRRHVVYTILISWSLVWWLLLLTSNEEILDFKHIKSDVYTRHL